MTATTRTEKNEIALLRIHALRGPNIWTYRPAIEVWLDLGELEDFPSNRLPGFPDRLLEWLPGLAHHRCGVGEPGGFALRLREGTWAGHVLEHVVIELLNLGGLQTGFGQTRSTSKRGVYRMVFRARDEQSARLALAEGHRLLTAAIAGAPFDVPATVARLREQIESSYFGPSTAAIVAAATDRGIPHIRLNDGNLVQLGHGERQRRIWTAETERTSAIAEAIAKDKDLTKQLVASCGVPVPEGEIVDSAQACWEAAEEIGLPVAVKPRDGNHGRGVTLDLRERDAVEAAYRLALRHGSQVIVERFIPGDEHRLLVVGGRVVAAARGESAWITGDGRSTVRELIDAQINSDPRRGDTEAHPLARLDLAIDDVLCADLERQGLSGDSVIESGRRLLIQRNGNVAIDCTDEVHPEVAHAASLAARVVGLDIAGIDLVCEDIGRPLQAQRGAIVEVNAGPGLLMHLQPAVGAPRAVGRAIVDHLFADPADDGRIPIVGVAGGRATLVARLVARLLHLAGRRVGLACRDGVFLDQRAIERCDGTRWEHGNRLLMNRTLEAAVLETTPEAILRDGLAADRCKVGVVTDLGDAAALADYDVHDDDQLAKVMRTQVDVVLADGCAVLNAGDARVAAFAPLSDGEVILYGSNERSAAIAEHCAAGGRAVVWRDGCAVLLHGAAEVGAPPTQRAVCAAIDADVLLAVVATGWALDVPADLVNAALETFSG